MGRSVGRDDQQLIKFEGSHDGAHDLEVSVVHRVESPSVCSYATFAHRFRFLVFGFGFVVLVCSFRFSSHKAKREPESHKPETTNPKLQTRNGHLACLPNLLDPCTHTGNKVIYSVTGDRRYLKHFESAFDAGLTKRLHSPGIIDRVHL